VKLESCVTSAPARPFAVIRVRAISGKLQRFASSALCILQQIGGMIRTRRGRDTTCLSRRSLSAENFAARQHVPRCGVPPTKTRCGTSAARRKSISRKQRAAQWRFARPQRDVFVPTNSSKLTSDQVPTMREENSKVTAIRRRCRVHQLISSIAYLDEFISQAGKASTTRYESISRPMSDRRGQA